MKHYTAFTPTAPPHSRLVTRSGGADPPGLLGSDTHFAPVLYAAPPWGQVKDLANLGSDPKNPKFQQKIYLGNCNLTKLEAHHEHRND